MAWKKRNSPNPCKALKTAGAVVDIISQAAGTIQAFVHHTPSIKRTVDKTFDDVSPDDYGALLLPAGALDADALRVVPQAQAFVTTFDHAESR
jgi:protease I